MYTLKQLETALALQTRLVRAGVDANYAELRVLRSLDRIDDEPIDKVADEIVAATEDRWMRPPEPTDSGDNFYNELRRRLEVERAAKENQRASTKKRLDEISTHGGR